MFQKRRIQSPYQNRSHRAGAGNMQQKVLQSSEKSQNRWFSLIGKILQYLFLFLCISLLLWAYIIHQKYIKTLPSVDELWDLNIPEASIIYDREWNELYKIFKEKRIYKSYEDISENMINALVAWEDKRYWENPWVDAIGLIRALLYGVMWKNEGFWGTSTLTQQLIRNTIIENRSSQESTMDKIERKIKEIYLSVKLTSSLSKEKIIELYLNKISFWSNAFGIEQAAETFFSKSAKDLDILESSMLASLPKWPSYYSPYNNYKRLVWYLYVYPENDPESITPLINDTVVTTYEESVKKFTETISWLKLTRLSTNSLLLCGLEREFLKDNISLDSDGCRVMEYSDFLRLLNSLKFSLSEQSDIVEYQTGRKDFILWRMLEDWYISFAQYKEALIESINFRFSSYRENIVDAHFVFYVREYLEEKYGKDLLEQWGLRIYTTLDPKLQQKAQEIIEKQTQKNQSLFDVSNASLISLDNETGNILAMVWWRDYFDEENKGNINMTTSRLQPGSAFKPFVYSLAIDQDTIGTQTPIYDLETTFPGDYTPANFDGEFLGKMNVSSALNTSRNIPAIKMYYLAWWEKSIMDWMKGLWVTSVETAQEEYRKTYQKEYRYGAAMALWTAPMTALEIAWAYSVLANTGYQKKIEPIMKILDSEWLVIEDNQISSQRDPGKRVIDSQTAYITNAILSDTSDRPDYWNSLLSLNDRVAAAKTGTSTKQFEEDGEKTIYPRNLWTAWYTPQITTVVWAGNNDGTPANFDGNGLQAAGPIWKEFMEFAHEWKPVKSWVKPVWVQEKSISRISGKLAWDDFPQEAQVISLFKNAPKTYDSSLQDVQVDLLCDGIVTDLTPISAIGNKKYFSLQSLRPTWENWETPVQEWFASGRYQPAYILLSEEILTDLPSRECYRENSIPSETTLGTDLRENDILHIGENYIEIWYRSSVGIRKIDVYLWEELIAELNQASKKNWFYAGTITIPDTYSGRHLLTIRAIDRQYYSQWVSYNINILPSDRMSPEIRISSPSEKKPFIKTWESFILKADIRDRSEISSINIFINGVLYTWWRWRVIDESIASSEFSPWRQKIVIEVIDEAQNRSYKEISLSLVP